MAIQTTTLAPGVDLVKNAKVAWKKGFDSVPVAARRVFSVIHSQTKTSEHSAIDYSPIASATGEGVDYAQSSPTQADTLNLTQGKVTSSFEVTQDMLKFDKYNMIRPLTGLTGLGRACPERMELDLQLFLMSMGFGTSYTDADGRSVATTGADGLAIYSSVHTINGTSATYDNLQAVAFGQTGLEAAEDLFRGFIDHQAHIIYVVPDTIITTSKAALVNLVREYNKSMGHVADANRGVNMYQGRYDHIVFHKGDFTAASARDSTKDDYWLLASLANNQHAVLEITGEPTLHDAGEVQRNRNRLFLTDCYYAYGMLGAQWIVGNNV